MKYLRDDRDTMKLLEQLLSDGNSAFLLNAADTEDDGVNASDPCAQPLLQELWALTDRYVNDAQALAKKQGLSVRVKTLLKIKRPKEG